jgi:hypothetical protein
MSFGKKIMGALFTTTEDEPQVDASRPLKEQVGDSNKPFTVINPVGTTTPVQPLPGQNFGAFTQPVQLDPQLQQKFVEHFNKVFMAVNDPKPSYHEYIAMVDSFGSSPQAFAMSFNGFKIQGLTKPTLVETAKHTLAAIQEDAVTYEKNKQAKLAEEVEAKRKLAMQKQEEIMKLQNEIQQLNMEAAQAEQEINLKAGTYAQLSQQYMNKISNDIAQIEANVQA